MIPTTETLAINHQEQKLITAALWKPSEENEFGIDYMYNSFIEVMKYRREIAKRLLDNKSEIEERQLKEMLEYCNEQISDILGI